MKEPNSEEEKQKIKAICDELKQDKPDFQHLKQLCRVLPNPDRRHWGAIEPNWKEPNMTTNPLKVAVMDTKSIQSVKFLIKEMGFCVDAQWAGVCRTFAQRAEIRGLTSLTTAVALNHSDMVVTLLKLGADINMNIPCYSYFNGKWHEYFTSPLLTAVELAKASTVNLLLDFGAKIQNVPTAHGGEINARVLAEQRQDLSVIKVIEQHLKSMKSLKNLCRFTIRNEVCRNRNYDQISQLKLPPIMISYLTLDE